jgi:hypothetical protein
MNFKSSTSTVLEAVEKFLSRTSSHFIEDSPPPDLVAPTFTGAFRIQSSHFRKEESLVQLAFLSWFLNDYYRSLIQVWLSERRLSSPNEIRKQIILSDKTVAISYFRRYHPREIYGNLIPGWLELLSRLESVHVSQRTRIVKPQRKRGYQDHGSRRPPEKWMETHDWSFYELQCQIEKNRKSDLDTAAIIEGWLS